MAPRGPRRKSTGQVSMTSYLNSVQCSVEENVQFKVPFLPLTSPEEPTPSVFRADVPLYAHQRRSLYRMVQIESRHAAVARFNFGMLDYYSKGGCLADAIGMGKTATILALIVSEPVNVEKGGNLLIAPSHLLAQWEMEVQKFVQPGEIQVVVGLRKYLSMDRSEISNRTLVLVGVEEAVASRAYYYHYHNIYPREIGSQGRPMHVDIDALVEYQEAAKFVSKAYSGLVWVTQLHLPEKPWRRVIFEEVQDLVLPGKESQDCFIQLTHKCENVWLITATPFPEKAESIYANNQLLGFKRLRLLPHDPAFDEIKRKLYLRNCAQVKQDAITNKIKVNETYISVKLHPRELLLYKIEQVLAASKADAAFDLSDDTASTAKPVSNAAQDERAMATANGASSPSSHLWTEKYDTARQSCVHVGISDRILDRERVRKEGQAIPTSVKVKSPAEVYKNEKYHLHRQLAVATMRKKEVDVMEAATRNTVAICRAIQNQVYSSVAQCFEDMEASKLDELFDRSGETKDGFRMLRSHYRGSKTFFEPTELILYHQDEIEDYLRKYWDSQPQIARLASIMESTLNERCPRARALVNEQLENLKECIAMKEAEEERQSGAEIPFYGTKITHLVEYLSRLKRIKVVVFTMWAAALKVVEEALLKNNISCAKFLQHQSSEVKSSHVLSFLTGDTEVLLLNSLTSASGINLQVASHVIFLDPVGYSAAQASTLEQQAIGRVLRMGQTNNEVFVVRFVAEQTLEATLYDEIHATSEKTRAADDSFFNGEQAGGDAYVCADFDKPIRRIVRMEVRSANSGATAAASNTSSGDASGNKKPEDDEEIEIAGAMSLEEAINQRVEAAAAVGVVFDLTEDADEDIATQLQAAAQADSGEASRRKRRRVSASGAVESAYIAAIDPFEAVQIKHERSHAQVLM
ncbi:Snf2 domain containing protein, partial [Globisporangium splendens]